MGVELNFFNTVQNLEPKCQNCEAKIDYGITTTWDEKLKVHICNGCGEVLK